MTNRQKIAYREAWLYHSAFPEHGVIDSLAAELAYNRLVRHDRQQFEDAADFEEELNLELALMTMHYKGTL